MPRLPRVRRHRGDAQGGRETRAGEPKKDTDPGTARRPAEPSASEPTPRERRRREEKERERAKAAGVDVGGADQRLPKATPRPPKGNKEAKDATLKAAPSQGASNSEELPQPVFAKEDLAYGCQPPLANTYSDDFLAETAAVPGEEDFDDDFEDADDTESPTAKKGAGSGPVSDDDFEDDDDTESPTSKKGGQHDDDGLEDDFEKEDDDSPKAGLKVQVPAAGGETEDDYGGDFEDGDTEAESPSGKGNALDQSASKDAYGFDDFEEGDGGSPGAASEGKLQKSGYKDDFEDDPDGFEESQFEATGQTATKDQYGDDEFDDDEPSQQAGNKTEDFEDDFEDDEGPKGGTAFDKLKKKVSQPQAPAKADDDEFDDFEDE